MVNLSQEGASLDFLGYTFRYDRDLRGRGHRYLNVSPSKKALQRERDQLHEMTNSKQCFKPIPTLIEELNRHLKGCVAHMAVFCHVCLRLITHIGEGEMYASLLRKCENTRG